MMIGREYEYRLKAGRVLNRAILYGAAALGMAYMALTNDRGLILFIIPLSKNGTTSLYGIFAGLAALFSISHAVNVHRRASLRQRIAFTKEGLVVPRSAWSVEEALIPYERIRDLKEFTEPDHVVVMRHEEGDFTLRFDMLLDERAFAEIVQNLALIVPAAQAAAGNPPPDPTQATSTGKNETPR
jgi:hypothetical protein